MQETTNYNKDKTQSMGKDPEMAPIIKTVPTSTFKSSYNHIPYIQGSLRMLKHPPERWKASSKEAPVEF